MYDFEDIIIAIEVYMIDGKRHMVRHFLEMANKKYGPDVANGLIRKFELNYHTNGGHHWFRGGSTRGLPPLVGEQVFIDGDQRDPTQREIDELEFIIPRIVE